MAKVRVMPASASAATTSGWTSKSLNSGAVSSTGAPPRASTVCSTCSGAGAPVSAWSMSGVVGVFSVEVSALASGRLGERPAGDDGVVRALRGQVSRMCVQRRRGQRTGARSAPG
jgi:hypothetical protein